MQSYFVRKSFGVLFLGFVLSVLALHVCGQNMFRKVNDFDGDGRADYAVTRNEDGLKVWYVFHSSSGAIVRFQWGLSTDTNAAGDYDGDGKTDFAVYRISSNPDNVVFYILQSQTNSLVLRSFFRHNFNFAMHQDYDGDGKTDPASWASDGSGGGVAIFLSATNSSGGFSIPFNSGPMKIGDMDGDGRADAVSFQFGPPTTLTITNSSTQTQRSVQFGLSDDRFQAADFDGDGKGDVTVFRPSDATWWWIRSSDNVVNAMAFGQSGDLPAPADYDGDGKTDIAIYRRGTAESPRSYYWIYTSMFGPSVFQWGTINDTPLTY
jgi:FG-GAP-like repeat